jgi:small-conductance mechanosensitive channel
MFGWTVHLARWGLVWAGYTTLQLPLNWTAVLNYIFPIPFIISLFFWTNALGDAIAAIGQAELEGSSGGNTKAVGFVEIVRVGKYVAFIIVLFIAVVIFGGNVVAFLNDAKLFGLIVVFALQPWLKNLVGGMTIFYDEKYVLGDEIKYAGAQGIVKNITLRVTRIERADNSVAIIAACQ